MSVPRREKTACYVEFKSPSHVTCKIFAQYERTVYSDIKNDKVNNNISNIVNDLTKNVINNDLGPNSNKSSTLPLSYRYSNDRQNSKDRDGYYSDRNEIIREKREREAVEREGYLSDYNSKYEPK